MSEGIDWSMETVKCVLQLGIELSVGQDCLLATKSVLFSVGEVGVIYINVLSVIFALKMIRLDCPAGKTADPALPSARTAGALMPFWARLSAALNILGGGLAWEVILVRLSFSV